MGRLIDADALIGCKILQAYKGQEIDKAFIREIDLDAIPTAYDVEKVVAELETLADNSNDHMYESYFDGKEDGIREAIEIVKAGVSGG